MTHVAGIDDRDDLSPNEKAELAAGKKTKAPKAEPEGKAKGAAPENKAVQSDENK